MRVRGGRLSRGKCLDWGKNVWRGKGKKTLKNIKMSGGVGGKNKKCLEGTTRGASIITPRYFFRILL